MVFSKRAIVKVLESWYIKKNRSKIRFSSYGSDGEIDNSIDMYRRELFTEDRQQMLGLFTILDRLETHKIGFDIIEIPLGQNRIVNPLWMHKIAIR